MDNTKKRTGAFDKVLSFGNKILSHKFFPLVFVIAIYAIVGSMLFSGNLSRQYTNMLTSISCYIALAVSLNLVVGLLGELSLGHAGFMSVGLFSGCLISILTAEHLPLAVRLPLSMVVGGIAAAIIGLVVGLPALRLKGDYLAIVTLGCGEIIKNIINNIEITGGPLKGVLAGALGLNTNSIYVSKAQKLFPFAFILVILVVIVMMNIKNSKHGRAIMAIRDNRIAAEATGINVTYYKLMVFILAAFFAGMAGVLYGHSLANIKATTFDYNMSIEILVIVVLGGMGSINGSVIAAIILRLLPEVLRSLPEMLTWLPASIKDGIINVADKRMLIYSILLIVFMLLKEGKLKKKEV